MFLISSSLSMPSIRHKNMISEWSKIDLRTKLTEIAGGEVTTDLTTITEMGHLLFSSQVRQKTR